MSMSENNNNNMLKSLICHLAQLECESWILEAAYEKGIDLGF
jgi:hypothetical protein